MVSKKLGAKFFPTPLGSGVWSKLFLAMVPKRVPKTGFTILGARPKKFAGGVKVSSNFVIFRLFLPFLRNGAIYQQSENGLLNYRHSSTRW